jgi:hypothetical protein
MGPTSFRLAGYSIMANRQAIIMAILSTATQRGPYKTTCPSEVARELFPDNWRNHMDEVRNAAIALSDEGKIIITQKGERIDTKDIKGPIRIKIIK